MRIKCPNCKQEIETDVCWCGMGVNEHKYDNHSFVPMGCDCLRHDNKKIQHKEAIESLRRGMTQLEPDGDNCHICGDNGHQAFECHHNPLTKEYHFNGQAEYWKCFHCNLVFFDLDKATEHFGERHKSPRPVCQHLCSGYGVLPDGRKRQGCLDCENNK